MKFYVNNLQRLKKLVTINLNNLLKKNSTVEYIKTKHDKPIPILS